MNEVGLSACCGRSVLPGFAALETLAEDFASSQRVREEAACFASGGQRQAPKQWMIKYQDRQEFTPTHPLYHAGIDLLPVVASVLGPCRYISADLWYVVPNALSRARALSQNWHRDPEADSVIKVMLFIREVDEESGPFEYVAGSHKAYYDACPPKSYLQPSGFAKLAGAPLMAIKCPAGTLAFVNTSGLHRGGYTKSKPRLSCVWTYVPESSDCQVKFSLN